jgi:hypothetical protein
MRSSSRWWSGSSLRGFAAGAALVVATLLIGCGGGGSSNGTGGNGGGAGRGGITGGGGAGGAAGSAGAGGKRGRHRRQRGWRGRGSAGTAGSAGGGTGGSASGGTGGSASGGTGGSARGGTGGSARGGMGGAAAGGGAGGSTGGGASGGAGGAVSPGGCTDAVLRTGHRLARKLFRTDAVDTKFPFSQHWVGVFSDASAYEANSYISMTSISDLDHDGDLDFADGQRHDVGGGMVWWEYCAPDHWVRHSVGTGHTSAAGGNAADIDRDGWVDLIAGDSWYRNPKNPRTATTWQRYGIGAPAPRR